MRVHGAKQPLHIRDHAVEYDGSQVHSSGVVNGDRWSLVLFVQSSWERTSSKQRKQFPDLGFPCPTHSPYEVAVPATAEVIPPQGGLLSDDAAAEALPPQGGVPAGVHADDSADEVAVVKGPKPPRTLAEAQSREHMMTHLPKNPYCDVCSKAKMQRRQKRKKVPHLVPDEGAPPPPRKFGDQVTGDHFIKNGSGSVEEEDPNFPSDTVAVVLFDRATRWLAVYPKSTKTTYHAIQALQHFAGPQDKIKSFYCDNAPELIAAATALHWRLSTATTGMPQTNGVAENCVRRTKEGGGCGIVQSGLNPQTFWPAAGEHYCFSTNIAVIDGDSSYNRRHTQGHFKGESVPVGALVDFMPQPDTVVASMGAKTFPGVFPGYHIKLGGLWNGDYLVADLAPFRRDCDVAKSRVKVHRTK